MSEQQQNTLYLELETANNNVASSYQAVLAKGGTIPQKPILENLPAAIMSTGENWDVLIKVPIGNKTDGGYTMESQQLTLHTSQFVTLMQIMRSLTMR